MSEDKLREALAGIYRSRDMLGGLNWRVQERIIDEDTATLRAALAAAPVAGEGLDVLRAALREALTMSAPGSNPTPQEWTDFITARKRLFALAANQPVAEERTP